MKRNILLLFFISVGYNGLTQIWNHPHPVYPYFSIGINNSMDQLKGLKSKTYTMYCEDTLYASFEYDTLGRLVFKADEHGDTSRYGYTNHSNEWVYAFDGFNDTICKREIKLDENNVPTRIESNYKNGSSVFELKRLNDSTIETYNNGDPIIKILFDSLQRQKTVFTYEGAWKTYLTYHYSKDTIHYFYYAEERPYEKVVGQYNGSNLISITAVDIDKPEQTVKRIQVYDENDKLVAIKSAKIDEQGQYNFKLTDSFKYDKNNKTTQWIQYGADGIHCRIEINYEYY